MGGDDLFNEEGEPSDAAELGDSLTGLDKDASDKEFQKALKGFRRLPNGLVRQRFGADTTAALNDLYLRVKDLRDAAGRADVEIPKHEAYLRLLTKNVSGGQRAEDVFENQGFKALAWFNLPPAERKSAISVEVPSCGICLEPFDENEDARPVISKCMHIFCLKCLQTAHRLEHSSSSTVKCPLCRNPIRGDDLRCICPAESPDDEIEIVEDSKASAKKTSATTSSTSQSPQRREGDPAEWRKSMSAEAAAKMYSMLPPGCANWDFSDPKWFALSKVCFLFFF